jgi:uncharacterized protein YecT (DUF1311 family)
MKNIYSRYKMISISKKLTLLLTSTLFACGTVSTNAELNSEKTQPKESQESAVVAQTPNCNEPQTTIEMNQCSAQEADAADQKLNQVYQQLTAKLDPKQRERMVSAQLAWIDFRDKTCEYERGQFEGGTITTSTYYYCIARITEQRVSDLETYLETLQA